MKALFRLANKAILLCFKNSVTRTYILILVENKSWLTHYFHHIKNESLVEVKRLFGKNK
jgi:hypothetical protein